MILLNLTLSSRLWCLSLLMVAFGATHTPAGFIYGTTFANSVSAYDTTTGNVTVVLSGLNSVSGITFGADGSLYVVERNTTGNLNEAHVNRYARSGTGAGIFTQTGTPFINIPLAVFGSDIVFDSHGTAYVGTSSGVKVFSAPGAPSGTLTGLNGQTYHLAISSTDQLYVTNVSNTVYKADLTGAATLSSFATVANSGSIISDSSGNLYVTSTGITQKFDANGVSLGNFGINSFTVRTDLAYDTTTGDIYTQNAPSLYRQNSSGTRIDISGGTTTQPVGSLPGSEFITYEVTTASVPEPTTLALAGAGLGGMILMRRRRSCQVGVGEEADAD